MTPFVSKRLPVLFERFGVKFFVTLVVFVMVFGPLLPFALTGVVGSGSPLALRTGAVIALAQGTREEGLPVIEGRVVPRHWFELSLPSGNRAETVLVEEGDLVKAGDVLLTLDGSEALAAQLATAELQVVLARQTVQDLLDHARVDLAQAELDVVLAQKEFNFRRDHLGGLERSHSQSLIDQAHANLLLAQERLERAREDLEKVRKKFANKKSLIWYFINDRYVRFALTGLEAELAYHERRAIDAQEKYDDLLKPIDPHQLALARAALSVAAAQLEQAQADRDDLLAGPDPDALEVAQARLNAAQAERMALQAALNAKELRAPMTGVVVSMAVQAGEWIAPRQQIVVIADLQDWYVETSDLSEDMVARVREGQAVQISLDAFPDQQLSGQVESIALDYSEDDGDIYYTLKVDVEQTLEGMRWGMRARLLLDGEDS
jgi:multidrug efflux pump subunit AcrA (membrane-fusion protein)